MFSAPLNTKKKCFLDCYICFCKNVYMYLLMPEWFDKCHSHLVLKSLFIIAWCLVNMNILLTYLICSSYTFMVSRFFFFILFILQMVTLLGRVISSLQGLYLNAGQRTHRINTYTYQTSMPCVEFETTIPASKQVKTVHALGCSATVPANMNILTPNIGAFQMGHKNRRAIFWKLTPIILFKLK
jgi:hypothetical protein